MPKPNYVKSASNPIEALLSPRVRKIFANFAEAAQAWGVVSDDPSYSQHYVDQAEVTYNLAKVAMASLLVQLYRDSCALRKAKRAERLPVAVTSVRPRLDYWDEGNNDPVNAGLPRPGPRLVTG